MHAARFVVFAATTLLACCGGGGSSNSQSSMTVPPGALVAANDNYTFYVSTGWSGSFTQQLFVLQNDTAPAGDAVTLVSASAPQHGSAVVQTCAIYSTGTPPPPRPCIVYQPTSGFVGIDTFSYAEKDRYGRTAGATITVTIADHYQLSGHVRAPAGSYAATQVGFIDSDARTPIDANGDFSFEAPVSDVANGVPRVLVADAPSHTVDFAALMGSFGEAYLDVSLDPFSTAAYVLLVQANGDVAPSSVSSIVLTETRIDWLDLVGRTAIVQLALEAGGVSAGLHSALEIASSSDIVAQLEAHFGTAAMQQRITQLLGDATLLPLLSGLPPSPVIVFAQDANVSNGALLLRPNSGGFDYVSTYGAGSATVRVTNGVTSITPTSGPAAQLGPLQLELLGALDDQVFGASLTSGGVLGNQLWSAEIAPPLSASTNPAGFQTADVAVVPMTIGGAEILPICAHPPAVAPENHPHVFHPDSTGAVVDTGATFTWMRTMVLSIRYSDQTLATFLALSPQDANGAKRVVADVTFADGEEALCSGSDVTQFSDQAAVGHESSGATPETGQSHPTRARKFPHPAK